MKQPSHVLILVGIAFCIWVYPGMGTNSFFFAKSKRVLIKSINAFDISSDFSLEYNLVWTIISFLDLAV